MIKHMHVSELTEDQRREGAEKARERLRGLLTSPFLTEEQAAEIHKKLVAIDRWEAGGA